MTIKGKPYEATGELSERRGVKKRRAVYSVAGCPTPEQQRAIDAVERGVVEDDWGGYNPYSVMRQAEYLGVELQEEELTPDGLWRPMEDPDAKMTMMQTGAIL